MKIFKLFILSIINCLLLYTLHFGFKQIPPLGKLLNPFRGIWQNADPVNQPIKENEIHLMGLIDSVEIFFDQDLVPHVFAKNNTDLAMAQGYVEAMLRLWQMEFQVIAAEGRLAEKIGHSLDSIGLMRVIEMDRKSRRIGMTYGARNKADAIAQDPSSQSLISAYTKGVNQYIAQLDPKNLPIEYKIMNYTPEPWSIFRSGLLLMSMSETLTSNENDIEFSNFIEEFGIKAFENLYKPWYDEIEPVVSSTAESINAKETFVAFDTTDLVKGFAMTTLDVKNKPGPNIGSNNWVLSGEKTKSKYPLLANDPHLNLTYPSIWLEMHLVSPEMNVYGVSFTGVPGIIIGFNDSIGWGVTNSSRDVKDWYAISFNDKNREEYLWDEEWKPCQKVVEEIKIRGKSSLFDTVLYTHIGPVTYDRNFHPPSDGKSLTLRWKALDKSLEFKTFYQLNKANNFSDYLEALKSYECPAQNFAFASVNGDIALRQQGSFAILKKGQGRTILPAKSKYEWKEYIPLAQQPMELNPEKGFVSSANQHAVDTTYPYYINGNFEYYRNRRINHLLRNLNDATAQDMIDMHYDNLDLQAKETLPIFLENLKPSLKNSDVAHMLREWDYFCDANSVEATFYELWWINYNKFLWDEIYNHPRVMVAPNFYQTQRQLLDNVQHDFIDNKETKPIETQKALINLAFQSALQTFRKLQNKKREEWGKNKGTMINHLARIPFFSKTVNVGGNNGIVNATGRGAGPSWRMVLDFSNGEIKGLGIYPGGQSGNPGSPYYDNFTDDWLTGEYHALLNEKDKSAYYSSQFSAVKILPK